MKDNNISNAIEQKNLKAIVEALNTETEPRLTNDDFSNIFNNAMLQPLLMELAKSGSASAFKSVANAMRKGKDLKLNKFDGLEVYKENPEFCFVKKDFTDGEGNTLLHIAAAAGNTQVIEEILYGKKPDCSELKAKNRSYLEQTPLDIAAENNKIDAVKALVLKGGEISQKTFDAHLKNTDLLAWAATEGHAKTVDKLLALGADVNAKNGAEKTPLFCATKCGIESFNNYSMTLAMLKKDSSALGMVDRLQFNLFRLLKHTMLYNDKSIRFTADEKTEHVGVEFNGISPIVALGSTAIYLACTPLPIALTTAAVLLTTSLAVTTCRVLFS